MLQFSIEDETHIHEDPWAACAFDPNLSRKLTVVMSLPLSESASRGASSSSKSFTDSGLLLAITGSVCPCCIMMLLY